MPRVRAGLVLAVLVALLAAPAPAFAQPTPPPSPSDEDLRTSERAVRDRAAEFGRLTARLAELDAEADDLAVALAERREDAEAALVDLQVAQDVAAAAAAAAADARVRTDAAGVAIDEARARLDAFIAATWTDGLDTGPLGLLTSAQTPEDLVSRSEFTDIVAREQRAAQEDLERARVDAANADSLTRALLDEARDREVEAQGAKGVADVAYAAADAAAREQADRLAAVDVERGRVQAQLDAVTVADAGLRDQRARYDEWQRVQAELEARRQRAEREAAAAREAAGAREDGPARGTPPAGRPAGSGGVQRVIDRALSQVGVQYVWGGGTGRGPSRGIPGPAGDPGERVGFDCSGLMLYAFSGTGVRLPRVSRNQSNAGRKVPVSDLRPGDLVFYRRGGNPIHHVALYIGGDRMVEAPYTGADVRVVPLRRKDLVPQATRVL